MPTKPKNKPDATLRNIRAANKRITELEDRLKCLEFEVQTLLMDYFTRTSETIVKKTPKPSRGKK